MHSQLRRRVCFATCLTALTLLVGCGVSERRLEQAQTRIDALKSQGVPDSALSQPLVLLYQARESSKRRENGVARQSADSMEILIAQAESFYSNELDRLKPVIDSMNTLLRNHNKNFSGMQKHKIDSCLTVIDSFTTLSWMLQAKQNAELALAMIAQLQFDEQRAAELRTRLPGTWVFTEQATNANDKTVNALKKKSFQFTSDGKVNLIETENGKRTPGLKIAYEFFSSGSYDFAGDTIHLFIDRFARKREHAETLVHDQQGKPRWESKDEPPFDSTITNGSQNRYILFQDLQLDFKRSN